MDDHPAAPANANGSALPPLEDLPDLPPPRASTTARNALIGTAIAAVALTGAVAGYRYYAKDRAETAAELVRIRAYLETTAKAEVAAPEKPVAKMLVQAEVPAEPPEKVAPAPHAKRAAAPVPSRPVQAKPQVRPRPQAKLAKAPPARPLPVADAGRPVKSVDQIFRERSARECQDGLLGAICREFVKSCLCGEHDAWGKAAICPVRNKPVPQAWPSSVG